MIRALVRTGVAIRTRTLVTSIVQTMIGIRSRVIPGARILKIVTRKLIEPRIELVPISSRATIHRSVPTPSYFAWASGLYSVQPAAAAPPPTAKPDSITIAAERQQPEREGVDPREGHVRRADHQRHDVVAEAGQDRDDEQEQHQRGVDRERLVVLGVGQELEAGLGQLDPDDQGEDPAQQEEQDRVEEVQDPDLLVVGRRQPLVQARPIACARRRSVVVAIDAPYLTVRVPVIFGWTEQAKV